MKPASRLLLVAIALSLLLHLGVIGSGLLPEASIDLPPDPALRKIDVKLQALALDEPPPAAAANGATTQLKTLPVKGASTARHAPHKKKIRPAKHKQDASAPLKLAAEEANNPVGKPAASEPVAVAKTTPAPTDNPAEPAETDNTPADKTAGNGYIHPAGKLGRFPREAKLHYQTFYNSMLAGRGDMSWQRANGGYRLEVNFSPIVGPNLRYDSHGQIGKAGLQPDELQAYKGNVAKESAHFDHDAGVLHYGDQGDKEEPLKPGAQDVFSLAFQLGLKGGNLGAAPIQITTGKKVYEYPMAASGETDYDTGSGKIRVIVFRAKAQDDLTEFWLAPDFANLPVRILRVDPKKRVELRAVMINVNGQQAWKLPPQPGIRTKNEH